MEANYLSFQYLQLDIIQVSVVGLILFSAGFWLGKMRTKRLLKQMAKMEKKIMDLNTELLYGKSGVQAH